MQKNKLFHILSYIPLFFLVSLFIPDKDAPSVRFHCGQGMILTVYCVLAGMLSKVVGFVIGWVPLIGWTLAALVTAGAGISVLVLMIIGIVNAVYDREVPLPIIGRYAFYC